MISFVFFHGLNTYGDDDLHIGPLRFGAMHGPWEEALHAMGHAFFAPLDLGTEGPFEQAERASEQLQRAHWLNSDRHLIFLGHSTGGLTARALASDPRLRGIVRGILTLGCPHHGTNAAELGLKLTAEYPLTQRLFRLAGYDTGSKLSIFSRYTPEALADFELRCALPSNTRAAHALCEVNKTDLSWPLRFFYDRLHVDESTRGHSDGFIDSHSQEWGECMGRFRLDHFGNLGFFFQLDRARRNAARAEFARLVDAVVGWAAQRT